MNEQTDDVLSWALGMRPKQKNEKRLDADALKAVGDAVRDAIKGIPAVPSADVVLQVAECVSTVLGTRVSEIAASAWNKRKEIAAYADTKKYPPGKEQRVTLYAHPIKWTYRPYVQVTVGKVKLPALEIVVDVTLTFDKAELLIDGGRIQSLRAGKVLLEGKAKVGAYNLCQPVKRELGELPLQIDFPGGLALTSEPLARMKQQS